MYYDPCYRSSCSHRWYDRWPYPYPYPSPYTYSLYNSQISNIQQQMFNYGYQLGVTQSAIANQYFYR